MLAIDVDAVNTSLEGAHPLEVLEWAAFQFPSGLAATSSFQTQSAPLLHMLAKALPSLRIYFIDTGFHFAETLQYRDRLAAEFSLHVIVLQPTVGHDGFLRQYGELHRHDPDRCCFLNKVEPFEQVKENLTAWIAGIRRDQTTQRNCAPVLSVDRQGRYKVCPMIAWTDEDVWRYIKRYSLPIHPLYYAGYSSIGCAPCTRPVYKGEGHRAGRWPHSAKTECGLHVHRRDQLAFIAREEVE